MHGGLALREYTDGARHTCRENRETGAEKILSYSGAAPATVSGVSPLMPLNRTVREGGETQ